MSTKRITKKEFVKEMLALMNRDTFDFAIGLVRSLQTTLTPEERIDLWGRITEGYCTDCGKVVPPTCHCTNEE